MLKNFFATVLSFSTLLISAPALAIIDGQKLEQLSDLRASTVFVFIFSQNSQRICTGTLIAKDLVLTAGHCSPDESKNEQVAIGFGLDANSAFSNNGKLKSYGTVVRTAVVEQYDRNKPQGSLTVQYDLAIMQFKGSLPAEAKPRALPEAPFEISKASTLVLSGYGFNNEINPDESALRMKTYPASQIADAVYDHTKRQAYDFPGAIIIEQPEGGVCDGDSGGPLFVQEGPKLTMVGVASYVLNVNATVKDGSQLCRGNAVFVDIRANLGWIKAASQALQNTSSM
ncbi:S1 family peptidase [Bdellovibrio sp. HCB209]|uniref:S1 family peptidase n=1 Tax=Bdellovibrio sp. HCB209 TaxID=3394354 RepID=UPI0039B364D7